MTIPSCSIIIPVYKEPKIKKTILDIIETFTQEKLDFEIIVVVDNADFDDTYSIVQELAVQHQEIKSFFREEKKGVADAIKTGILNAEKNVTLIVMGDGSESSETLINLVSKMSQNYDMVFANRFSAQSKIKSYPKKKLFANRLCNFVIKFLFNFKSQDITNAVKVYKTNILKNLILDSQGFEIFAEIPLKLFKQGFCNFTEITIDHDAGDEKYSKFDIFREGPRYFKIILKCFFQN